MGGEGRDSSLGWWGVCLWGTLTIVSLCLGVAALWLPLDRHLQIEERLLELELKHNASVVKLLELRANSSQLQEDLRQQVEDHLVWKTKIQGYQQDYKQLVEAMRKEAIKVDAGHGAILNNLRQQLRDQGSWQSQGLDERQPSIAESVEECRIRVSALEGRVASVDNDVGNQEAILAGQRNIIEEMSEKLTRDINSLMKSLSDVQMEGLNSNQTIWEEMEELKATLQLRILDVSDTVTVSFSSLEAKVEELMDDLVSADEIANIHLRLANISFALEDHGGADEMLQDLMARMASFESALEAANADSKVVEESQKDLDQRLGSLEEGGWEERLRGLVMRVNQFQQNIRQVKGIPQQLQRLQNRLARLENLVQA